MVWVSSKAEFEMRLIIKPGLNIDPMAMFLPLKHIPHIEDLSFICYPSACLGI